jgi:dCTP diphosphatase
MDDIIDINKFKEILQKFASDRDWCKFHNPKNICMAISSEVGELSEIFQWLSMEDAVKIKKDNILLGKVKEEISDIMLYSLLMASVLNINIKKELLNKIEKNKKKYPKELVRGSAKKYSDYSDLKS